jgi:ubiquitin C-terminal hydrolase
MKNYKKLLFLTLSLTILAKFAFGMGTKDNPIVLVDDVDMTSKTVSTSTPTPLVQPTTTTAVTSNVSITTPTTSRSNPKIDRVGLQNLGNTCFMNASIQALSNIEPLIKFLLQQQNVFSPVIDSYIKLLKELKSEKNTKFEPADFLSQNLLTLNKNNLQNQIQSDIYTKTKVDKTAIENLRKETKKSVIDELSVQEKALINGACTKSNYDQFQKLNSKINQQTEKLLKQNDSYKQHDTNIQQIRNDIFSTYKNRLIQYYGTEEMAKAMFNTSSQQDAAEFLSELLNQIINKTAINSSTLQLKTIKQDTCKTCLKQTNPIGDTFSIFNLPIQKFTNLTQCLNAYMQTSEEIEKYCQSTQCQGQNKTHTRTIKIQEAPPLLIIQLNRFSRAVDPETGSEATEKINTAIKIPFTLNLKDYLVQTEDAIYDLTGFICHNGLTANSGHYIAYAKDYVNQNWYLYNDSIVDQKALDLINNIETLGFLPTGIFKKNYFTDKVTNIDEGIYSTPYVLFYQKQERCNKAPAPATNVTSIITAPTPTSTETSMIVSTPVSTPAPTPVDTPNLLPLPTKQPTKIELKSDRVTFIGKIFDGIKNLFRRKGKRSYQESDSSEKTLDPSKKQKNN